MEDLLSSLPGWVQQIPGYFTGLVLIASVVVRFTDGKEDDKLAGKASSVLLGLLSRFPTIGLNPNTKRMKAALEALEKDATDKGSDSSS